MPKKKGFPPAPPIERFLKYVQVEGEGCWLWTGGHSGRYGLFYGGADEVHVYAHRWSYTTFVGPIPEGLVINHLCEVRMCVRPDHLEAVTVRENARYGNNTSAKKARQTHCVNGHEFTEDNTRIRVNGCRSCRACDRERAQAKRDAQKTELNIA